MRILRAAALVLPFLLAVAARAEDDSLSKGLAALKSMSGCFLVDYSYAETEALKPSYVLDRRVYDVTRKKSVKEWIVAEQIGPRRLRLQHVLFFAGLDGRVDPDSLLKHQTEDWEYDAPFLYDFVAPSAWTVRRLDAGKGLWTRRVTNLDDGLRYQCAAPWDFAKSYPEWSCSDYAPIPGRETRDMGRKDYDALDRTSRLILYDGSWLERQDNVKTIQRDGRREPLAREMGKNWYVRIPDRECAPAREFVMRREAFWSVLRQAWDGVLTGDVPFSEKIPAGHGPRFTAIDEIEQRWLDKGLSSDRAKAQAKKEILEVIALYRAPRS